MRIRLTACGAVLALAAFAGGLLASEWPSWRGPYQNGVSDETGLVDSWSTEGENLAWSADFTGRSTPVVFQGRVCAMGRTGSGIDKQEMVACFHAGTGELLWEHRFNIFHTTIPFTRSGWTKPAGDPETGNLYTHGVQGLLTAFDARGKILWQRSLTEEFGRFSGYGGRTHSPIVDEDRVVLAMTTVAWGNQVVPKQRYYAFDKKTGELVWISDVAGPATSKTTYSTPVVTVIGGRRLLIGGNSDGAVYAIESRTGKLVWKFRLGKLGLNTSVAVVGDRVYATTGDEVIDEPIMGRVVCIDGTGEGDVTDTHEVWRASEILVSYASPVVKDGVVYVIDDSANLHALDADDGTAMWVKNLGTVGRGSPVWADGKIYATETNGHFIIVKPSRQDAEILDQELVTVEGGRYAEIYGSPAVAYGRVYFTSEAGIFALGDPDAPFEARRGTPPELNDGAAAKGAVPATLQLRPAEVLARPGQLLHFKAYLYDDHGHFIGRGRKLVWGSTNLSGKLESGDFTPDAGAGGQAGVVVAKLGDLVGNARVRVVPNIPFEVDFEDVEVGKNPSWFVAAGARFKVEEKDGSKVLAKPFFDRGVERQIAFLGRPDASGYTIQAELMGTKKGRRMPDMGLVNGRYILDMQGNHQRLQLRDWAEERFEERMDFAWEPDVWYVVKLRVDQEDDRSIVQAKIWKKGEPEPEDWAITGEDPLRNPSGSPGLYGYSPTTIYYDNVVVTENR